MNKLLAFFCLMLASCAPKDTFEQYVTLGGNWHKDKPVSFRYAATDTLGKYNLYLLLRNDEQYPYSNIFLIAKTTAPNHQVIVDTLEYEMADAQGRWLGTGFSEKESKLWFKEGVRFSAQGDYLFSVQQADRSLGDVQGVENLKGITQVGLIIQKVE